VYDPATNKGNIAATLTQGSFRYIGGKLSKQGNATLKTPVATIGIRGSDVTVGYEAASKAMNVLTTHGVATVQMLSGGSFGLRSGFGATIDGIKPPTPTALSAQQIAAANGAFEGQPGKSAGAGKPPTNGDVAKSGLSSSVEAKGLAAIEPAAGGAPGGAPFNVPFQLNTNDTQPLPPKPPTLAQPAPAPRTEQGLNGYVAGFGFRNSETTNYSDILTNDRPTDVVIQARPDPVGFGRVLATFNFGSTNGESLASASVEFGDPLDNSPAVRSVYLSDDSFVATQGSPASAGKGQINGSNASADATMASLPGVTLTNIRGVPGNDLCTCEFVKWGLWFAELKSADAGRDLIVPIALWVAGKLPDVNDPSPTGVATFSGTALGIVQNQGVQSFKTGTFTNDYDFSRRAGQVTISNFDGKAFGGQVNAGTDWRSYSGSLAGSGLTGGVNGAFYGNRATPGGALQVPKETAGNFNVGNSGYAASGIFIGKR
jgi:hypothetical protein